MHLLAHLQSLAICVPVITLFIWLSCRRGFGFAREPVSSATPFPASTTTGALASAIIMEQARAQAGHLNPLY